MGTRIEGAISKIKREAQRDGGKKAGRGRPKQEEKTGCGKLPQANLDDNKTRTDTAKAVGMKPRTYDKAKQVVESGNQAAIEQMNKTGKVDPAFRAVKRERITYRVPDPTEVERPDIWCCRIGGRHFLTPDKTLLERRMDLAGPARRLHRAGGARQVAWACPVRRPGGHGPRPNGG